MEQLTRSSSTESRAAKMIREVFGSGRPIAYIRSAEEQRVARVLREVAHSPVWTWSITEGMRLEGEKAADADTPRAALDFIAAHERAAIFHLKDFHEPLRDSPRSAGGCAMFTRAASTGGSSSSSLRRCASFRRRWSAASCISNCGRPTSSNWWSSCGRRRGDDTSDSSPRPAGGASAGPHAGRSALCLAPRAYGEPAARAGVAAGAAGREAAAGQPQRRDRIHRRRHEPRRSRRPGGSKEMAAGAPQAFPDARQPDSARSCRREC